MLFSADDVGEFKFYVWASLIVDGEAVATDYAPNIGWLTTPVTRSSKQPVSKPA